MSILFRYMIRQNLLLLSAMFLIGTGIYSITDLFERMATFLEAGTPISTIFVFSMAKLPSIIGQIFPAVFLMASVVQMYLLDHSREKMALLAGGVSPAVFVLFFVVYGAVMAGGQFFLAQAAGTHGERFASQIWAAQAHRSDQGSITNLWFTENDYFIYISYANAREGTGMGLRAYKLGADGLSLEAIIRAQTFTIDKAGWHLADGQLTKPIAFSKESFDTMLLPIKENLHAFIGEDSSSLPRRLSLWELGEVIEKRKNAGSNVESLLTAWHGKLAYAVSVLVVGLYALALSNTTSNIYKSASCAVVVIFAYYSANMLVTALGEKGVVPPYLAAWGVCVVNLVLALLWLSGPTLVHRVRTMLKPL